jgi:hypothetical protein
MTISPFIIEAYAALLTTTITKVTELSASISAQKFNGRNLVDATLLEIDDVIRLQESAPTDIATSDYEALHKKRLDLGGKIAAMAMLDATLDNHTFTISMLKKRVDEVKGQVESVNSVSVPTKKARKGRVAKKRKRENGDNSDVTSNGAERWSVLMEMVNQVVAETGGIAAEVEDVVMKVEGSGSGEVAEGVGIEGGDESEDEKSESGGETDH